MFPSCVCVSNKMFNVHLNMRDKGYVNQSPVFRKNQETLLRNAIAAFPYHHSLLYETMAKVRVAFLEDFFVFSFQYAILGYV